MKQFKTYTNFSFIVLLSLFVTIPGRGEDVQKMGPSNLDRTESGGYEIIGTVEDASQQLSLEKLATAKSFEEFFRIFGGMMSCRSAANVTVTAKGVSVTNTTLTDSRGNFKFTGLPAEHYEISAEMPSRFFGTGKERIAKARIPFRFDGHSRRVCLKLRTDLVTIKRLITDSGGHPISGAKIRGIPVPCESGEVDKCYPERFAVSGTDGSYELSDMVPFDILKIAGYLMGGDPTSFGQYPFFVVVSVEANGYVQDKKNKPRVPLVTEELLVPARRLVKIMSNLETLTKGSSKKIEKADIYLPSSQSNTITGIDIVLKKTDEAKQ